MKSIESTDYLEPNIKFHDGLKCAFDAIKETADIYIYSKKKRIMRDETMFHK